MRKAEKSNKNNQKVWSVVLALYFITATTIGIGLLLVQNGTVGITDTYELMFAKPGNGEVRYRTTITTNTGLEYDKQGQPVLQARQIGSRYLLSIGSGTNNRTASVPVGTRIVVSQPDGEYGEYRIRIHPRSGVISTPKVLSVPKGRYHFPLRTAGMYEVTGEGTVTISVIER